jgi:hypothetical protein
VCNLSIKLYRIYACYTNIMLCDVIYSVRYYPHFSLTAVGLGMYYPQIQWSNCNTYCLSTGYMNVTLRVLLVFDSISKQSKTCLKCHMCTWLIIKENLIIFCSFKTTTCVCLCACMHVHSLHLLFYQLSLLFGEFFLFPRWLTYLRHRKK